MGQKNKGKQLKRIIVPMDSPAQIGDKIKIFYEIIKKGDEKNESEGKDKMV